MNPLIKSNLAGCTPALLLTWMLVAGCGKGDPGETPVRDAAPEEGWTGTAEQFDAAFVQHGGRLNTLDGYTGTLAILDEEARQVSQETFEEGIRVGPSIRWYDNGNKQIESTYVSGKRSGPTFEWYLDGKKKVEKEYSSGIAHGKEVSWYDDGAKHYERHYVGGSPDGIWTDWDRGGNIVRQVEYSAGRAVRQLAP